ncbi:hypothetical protein FB451DRAFT_1442410 [Mycena latifolia]|nr:hypothetical protein FB451DRAFT_1442410 [Mycena latifolia]
MTASGTAAASTSSSESTWAPCGAPLSTSYLFYSPASDQRLGEVIRGLCERAEEPCSRREETEKGGGCSWKEGEHVLRVVHGGVRVEVRVGEDLEAEAEATKEGGDTDTDGVEQPEGGENDAAGKAGEVGKGEESVAGDTTGAGGSESKDATDEPEEEEAERITMWLSCALCGARTARRRMSDGAFLLSYAKFLELLVYSSAVGALGEPVCVHTASFTTSTSLSASGSTSTSSSAPAPPADADFDAPLPPARLHLVRHFACAPRKGKDKGKARVVSFALSEVKDVYELRVPRVRIVRGGGRASVASEARNSIASVASSTAVSVASLARERDVGGSKAGKAKDTASSARSSLASSYTTKEGGGREGDEEKRALRREIRAWWAGVGECVERMVGALTPGRIVGDGAREEHARRAKEGVITAAESPSALRRRMPHTQKRPRIRAALCVCGLWCRVGVNGQSVCARTRGLSGMPPRRAVRVPPSAP